MQEPTIAGKAETATGSSLDSTGAGGSAPKVSISDLSAAMQAQGLPASAQSHILNTVMGALHQTGVQGSGSTLDMASVLAKIQSLEKEKNDLESKLHSSTAALAKYREEKSVVINPYPNDIHLSTWNDDVLMNLHAQGMKDRYVKEMKDFIEGLQLKDPEVKKSMHERMETLANQGNETGVWEILACASSNHRANVHQIEALNNELNSYREKERQLQGGVFGSESSRVEQVGTKRVRQDQDDYRDPLAAASSSSRPNDPSNIWMDFQDMVMRQGGNTGSDYSQGSSSGLDPYTLR